MTSVLHIPLGGLDALNFAFPDLNPFVFFWGHLKSLVYETPMSTVEDCTANIASTPNLFKGTRQSFVRRGRRCYNLFGRNFEQFL
ncbi:hypothetical protein TNCV_2865501 [Trichonephila clavipes]|nr:hypothetical protein TNCV_2865501 [Trichonephila clavipes]